jgi:hypothetical protein
MAADGRSVVVDGIVPVKRHFVKHPWKSGGKISEVF